MKKLIKIVLVLCVLMQFYSVACDLQKEKIEESLKITKKDSEAKKINEKIESSGVNVEKKEKKDISKDVSYKNERFGFSIVYPGFFEFEEVGFNNEGKTVWDKEEQAKLVMFGENNLNSKSVKKRLNEDINFVGKGSLKKEDNDEYAISWESGSKKFYKMVKVGKGSIAGFLIEYPEDAKVKYDEVISKLCKSLKAGDLSKVH